MNQHKIIMKIVLFIYAEHQITQKELICILGILISILILPDIPNCVSIAHIFLCIRVVCTMRSYAIKRKRIISFTQFEGFTSCYTKTMIHRKRNLFWIKTIWEIILIVQGSVVICKS